MKNRKPSSVRGDVLKIMEKGENDIWICMESILNQDSEGYNPDPFLIITTGKLLIRWNWLAEERPRNVIPKPTCLPTKSCARKGTRPTLGAGEIFLSPASVHPYATFPLSWSAFQL